MGGLGVANPSGDANLEYTSSVKVTAPLVEQIVAQVHQLPEDSLIRSVQQEVKAERAKNLEKRAERLKEVAPQKTRRALDLATGKMWLTSLPLKEMGFNLNKREFRDGLSLRYDWSITDIPSTCLCGEPFTIDHAMICMRGVFVIQRNNELRDLEAELLNMVCKDVVTEPVLQDVEGEQLTRGSNKAQDARLDIHARGFWEPQRSAFFDVRVCHPNAESYRDLEPQQIYRLHENEKKRQYLIINRPVTRILFGGVLTRPKWTKLPKCNFYLILFNWRPVNFSFFIYLFIYLFFSMETSEQHTGTDLGTFVYSPTGFV